MDQCSQVVLFVFSEYLNKNIVEYRELHLVLAAVSNQFHKWMRQDIHFVRSDGQPLQRHVENSICLFIGNAARHLFRDKVRKHFLMSWLTSLLI